MSAAPVYLDHAATTPLDARVLDSMMPYLTHEFGNASSRQHERGREAAGAVEHARGQIALLLGADPREVVFTSGATESNNLALKGVCRADAHDRMPRRIVTAVTEHHAVLDPLDGLERDGFEVVRLPVDSGGHIDLERLEAELAKGVRLVSLMWGNNETGVVHPIASIGALCRERGALFHTDATQAVGKEPIDVDAAHVDLLSLSAHKFYGPKGVGALYLRRKRPRVRVAPLLEGGGHEQERRSGTLNVPGIVGLGAAAELCSVERESEVARLAALRDHLERGLAEQVEGVERNGHATDRLASHSNLSFEGVDAEALLASLPGVCASSSAACTSAKRQPSHVLRALGVGADRARGSVRFSLGRTTTPEDIEVALPRIIAAVRSQRSTGPTPTCS